MALLFFLGIVSLVGFMLLVMGVPFIHYLRSDRDWQEKGAKLEQWYGR